MNPASELFAFLRRAKLMQTREHPPEEEFAASYDRIASQYDSAWLVYTKSITDILVDRLPATISDPIYDLGCGTGYSTFLLARKYRNAMLSGVDISQKMLDAARERVATAMIHYQKEDMLKFLDDKPMDHAGLIFAGWSLGYSDPIKMLDTGFKKLKQDGVFAFIIEYADSLAPVYDIFMRCMREFPQPNRYFERRMLLQYPKDKNNLYKWIKRSGLLVSVFEDGYCGISSPGTADGTILSWLLNTGVLAGLDRALSITEYGPAASRFEQLLSQNTEPLRHHYAMVIAKRM